MAERRGVPHHLLDVWDVTRTASVADYQALAARRIDDIAARGRVPVLVGGSGLYVRAVLDDLSSPAPTPRCGRGWRPSSPAAARRCTTAAAARRPGRGGRDPAGNGRRIVRALEVIELTGRPFTATLPGLRAGRPAVQIGLALDRPDSTGGSTARVDRMWAAGFEAEVSALAAVGLREGRTASRALGYQQVLRDPGRRMDRRAGPRGDRPGHPPLRPPSGILVQQETRASPGSSPART